jgi:hypothetical protein
MRRCSPDLSFWKVTVGAVMHPVGPRSSGTYWIRRMFVAVLAVAVVAGVVWFVVGRASGPGVDPAANSLTTTNSSRMTGVLATDLSSTLAGSDGTDAVSSTTANTTKAGPTKTTGTTSTSTKATSTKATGKKAGKKKAGNKKAGDKKNTTTTGTTSTATKSTATKATATKSTGTRSTATKSTATSTKATTTAPPKPSYDDQGRLLCPDASIKVVATTGQPSYPVGSQPILGMTVTNTGSKACVRDLSGPLQVYTVYSKAGKRIWSTSDCFPGQGSDVRELSAGQSVSYNIKWSGTTSTPGCSTPRVPVTAGSYTVVAALGKLASKPRPFTITG